MKSSTLLKPNKITFTHQSKTNQQNKPKSSSRYPSAILQKSTLSDVMMDKIPSKKNVIGKENQQKNIQTKQSKRQSNPKLKKASQLYMNEKMNRLNKVYRNQSMHMIRDQNFDDIQPFYRLNNSSINQKQNIHKKKKVSKSILDNLPSNQQNNSLILNRSSFSDKMILVKEKKDQISNAHFQSCKNLQSNKIIQQSKSYKVLQKRTSTANKPGIYLVKNNPISTQHSQSQRNSVTDLMNKNQNKTKNIFSSKQPKTQQTSRKIKRTKLAWLILVNNLYTLFNQKSKKVSHDKKTPTLFDLVHYLKNFQKKYHSQQELFMRQQIEHPTQQKVSLAELLKFFKIVLNREQISLPHTVWKQGSKEIDAQKTQISFNSFGKIIFSHENIIQQLERQERKSKFPKPNEKSSKNCQKQTEQTKNHTGSSKQDQDIVETARFQNHQNSPSPLHPCRQQIEVDKKLKKKNIIFTKDDEQLIYQQGVGNLISKKLTKDKGEQKKQTINIIEKSFNKKDSFLEKKYQQKSRLKILQNSSEDWKSNVSMNKQQSHSSIEDISQILQVNQNDKLLITSFNRKYNSKKESSFSDPFHCQQMTQKDLLFRNSNGMSEGYNSNCNNSDQLALDQCRLQALNMNSSQLFLQSVILSNLYHTNFNISFSDQPIENQSQLFNTYRNLTHKLKYSKLQDVVQEIQNILKSMKNLFAFDQDPLNDNKMFFKTINKESIKIQDLTEIQDFLSQFIDYKVFRKDKKSISDQEYFNAVKLTQNNLTSSQTKKAAGNVIKSGLIQKYFEYFEAIRINQGYFMVQNIEMLIGNSSKIKILNLAENELEGIQSLIKVIENNIDSLQFLNLSSNQISSLEPLFQLLQTENDKRRKSFSQLRQLYLKNNKITRIGLRRQVSKGKLKQQSNRYYFPRLQLLDLRSNLISKQQKESIQVMISESPQLSIMSLKLNPILENKQWQKNQIQKLLNQRSIYQYDSLQMMSAYIKYKDITFTDSNQGCCSLIQADNLQLNNV